MRKKGLQAAGHTDYVTQIIMVDTDVTRFEIQNQIDTLPQKDVEGQIKEICTDIETRRKNIPCISVSDKIMDWLYHAVGATYIANDTDKSFIVNEACIKCGICAKICPADNIKVTNHVEDLHHCEGCLGCLHGCPENAIHLKNEQSEVRYRNAGVSLKELIDANN